MTKRTWRFGVVAAMFNKPLMQVMIAAARAEAESLGGSITAAVEVPGCYEVPLVAKRLFARGDVDAVIALGYIERGETLHGSVMGNVVHGALMDLSLAHDKPAGLGIIGPGATVEQAELRKDSYARAAVRAAYAALEAAQA